jgi:hypothetical protein
VVKQVKESSRAKESQLVAMTNAHLVVDPNQVTHVTRTTYVQGMAYDDYINVTTSNRGIQAIKHSATPESGYLTRQLLYACDNWVLNAVQRDEENAGLLLPSKLAIGRTLLDGTIYNGGGDKYVRVRSVVTSSKPRFVVTPDMLNAKFHSHLGDNYQIGASFATSLTEGITQSALGLKHGGTLQDYDHGDLPARPSIKDLERIKDHGTFLYAPEDCTLDVQDLFIVLKSRSKMYKYPKPQNVSFLSMNQDFKKGDLICIIPEQYTPGMKCDSILKFIGASGTRIPLKYLRNSVVVSDCYCIKEGTIRYGKETVSHQGHTYEIPTVMIGGVKYKYNPNCSYQIPDGDVVKVGQRICSGICSMGYVFNHYGDKVDLDVAYSIFYDQITKLNPGIATELLELVYAVIFTDYNEKTKTHFSVNRSLAKVLESDAGTYQIIANKSPKAKFEKIDPFEGEDFVVDEMSTRMLMTLISNLNQ